MEWRKENISKTELERMQKEYSERAMSMRSRAADPQEEAVHKSEIEEQPEVSAEETVSEAAEVSAEAESEEEPAAAAGNFGVFSADEVIKRSDESDNMKKASEILEEITRRNEAAKSMKSGSSTEDGAE